MKSKREKDFYLQGGGGKVIRLSFIDDLFSFPMKKCLRLKGEKIVKIVLFIQIVEKMQIKEVFEKKIHINYSAYLSIKV